MAKYDRRKTWADGDVLTADDLNAEFDEVREAVNNIEAEQISDYTINADCIAYGAITQGKIADGAVSPDKLSGNISSDKARIYDSGIHTVAKNGGTLELEHGLIDADGNNLEPKFVKIMIKTTASSPWSGYHGTVWMEPTDDIRYGIDDTKIYLQNNNATDDVELRVIAW